LNYRQRIPADTAVTDVTDAQFGDWLIFPAIKRRSAKSLKPFTYRFSEKTVSPSLGCERLQTAVTAATDVTT
jgi:hypothetical protein